MRLPIVIASVAATLGAVVVVLRQELRRLLSTIGPKWSNLHPDVQARALDVLEAANQAFADRGLRVGIFDGWRSLEAEQREILNGTAFISKAARSFHTWGLAVDFVFIDKAGRWTWLPDPANPQNTAYRDPRWYELGALIEAAGFEWGGRWSQFDGPHAQLPIERTATLIADYPGGFDQWQRSWA